jgi:membrane-associated phospholipid phosphatase
LHVRSSEWVAFLYFLYLGTVCWLRPLSIERRLLVSGVSCGLLVAIWVGAVALPPALRDWAPLVYVSIGYYATGWLFVEPSKALESWLLMWDRRLLGDPATRFAAWPKPFVGYLEVVYMLCFLLLPGGYAALVWSGQSRLANHYWTMVLAADLGAFAPLSVFQTRPPWLIEPKPVLADKTVHRLASYMVQNATIRVNTFPSGHVAVSFAIAAALVPSMPVTAVLFFLLSLSISIACVVGRYHYVIDVLTGAALAAVVWIAIAAAGI